MRTLELGPVEAIPVGEGRAFVVGGEPIAVFRTRAGRLFATQAFCPHARGPLADGIVGSATVLCPLHAFAFDLESGRCLNGSCSDLRHYPVTGGADGTIRLQLPADDDRPMALAGAGQRAIDERGTAA